MQDRPKSKALTLTELLLAVTLLALLSLTVTTVVSALSGAQAQAGVLSDAVQSARSGMMRIETVLRKCKLVTSGTASSAICWMGDANADFQINLSELIVFHRLPDARTLEVWRVIFPATLSPAVRTALDVPLTLQQLSDAAAIVAMMRQTAYGPYLQKVVYATDVESFQVGASPPPPFTERALLRLKAGPAGREIMLTNSAVPRATVIDRIEMEQGVPVLHLN